MNKYLVLVFMVFGAPTAVISKAHGELAEELVATSFANGRARYLWVNADSEKDALRKAASVELRAA